MKTTFVAATFALALSPIAAHAVPVELFDETVYSSGETLSPDETATWDFVAGEDLDRVGFSVAGTGLYDDLLQISYIIGGTSYDFIGDIVGDQGDSDPDAAYEFPDALTNLAEDDEFSILASLSAAAENDANFFFTLTAVGEIDDESPVNPVPLPAAGFLLGFGILGLGALRKLKAA